ncbi:hypothetical protein PHSC3_001552 [Chlamydiales bacterium STE3]|nr:hypothetical protein PHSC3_001552 [Chlamydiales bacterium STE3]
MKLLDGWRQKTIKLFLIYNWLNGLQSSSHIQAHPPMHWTSFNNCPDFRLPFFLHKFVKRPSAKASFFG